MNTIYIRNAEGLFVCPEPGCGAVKNRQNTMFYHVKRHREEMQHVCSEPGCGKRFVQKSGLEQHRAQRHSSVAAWNCPFCDHSAKMRPNLLIHIGRKHGVGWIPPLDLDCVCKGCDKQMASAGAYAYHAVQCFAAPPDIAVKLAAIDEKLTDIDEKVEAKPTDTVTIEA
jgi:hypothetical protein